MSDPITVAGIAGTAGTVLNYVNDFRNRAASVQAHMDAGADSLVSYTKPARAEPIVMIDSRAVNLPETRDVLVALTSLYAGYYMQAVALGVGVGRINTIKLLDQFNPERSGANDVGNALLEKGLSELSGRGGYMSQESYRFGLPAPDKTLGLESYRIALSDNYDHEKMLNIAIESDQAIFSGGVTGAPGDDLKGKRAIVDYGNDTIKNLADVPNLAVGKMLELKVNDGNVQGTIPVEVRLIPNGVDSSSLVHILSDGVKDSSARERWHAWRSGAIGLADMLFAIDAIDAHRKALFHDKSGSYAEIQKRRRNNGLTTLRSGIGESKAKVSIGTASNMVVMTQETADEVGRAVNSKLENAAVRNTIFEQSYLMFMVVIDTEWQHVTIYTRGIAQPMNLTLKQIQNASKGSGPDVTEILKAYRLGTNPPL